MNKPEVNQTSPSIDKVRRKLLKLGIYSVPAILLIGKVTGAKASGGTTGTSGNRSKSGDNCDTWKQIISFGQWC